MRKMIENKRDILTIVGVFLLAHWLIIVVSGYWWDDATVLYTSLDGLKHNYNKIGYVCGDLSAYAMHILRGCYKPAIFIIGLMACFFFWGFLRNSKIFDTSESLWITVLFATIPINDARITFMCIHYTICHMMFCAVLYLTTLWKRKNGIARYLIRGLCLALLFVSYNTASLLFFTGIIIIWMIYFDVKGDVFKWNNVVIAFVKNIDYALIPCICWIIKSIYFKPYETHVNYNEVDLKNLSMLPRAAVSCCISIVANYFNALGICKWLVVILICGMFLLSVAMFIRNRGKGCDVKLRDGILLSIGLFVYIIGIFPYVIVGNGTIATTGVYGRDSMLCSFGLSTAGYFLIKFLFNGRLRQILYVIIVVAGIMHFNLWYLYYQEDWYETLEFKDAIASEDMIKDNDTFWVIQKHNTRCGATRFYTWCMASYETFGDKRRLFAGLDMLANPFNTLFLVDCGIDDYDYSDMTIDGIIVLDNEMIPLIDVMKLRIMESMDNNKFNEYISALDRYEFIELSPRESSVIISAYNNGMIAYEELLDLVK